MSFKVILEITMGSWAGTKLPFDEKVCKGVGRDEDPHFITLPDDYKGVSRKHCLLDINPPFVTVKDLGSANGTYVNGELIGMRSNGATFGLDAGNAGFPLKSGDILRLGANCEIKLMVEFSKNCKKYACDVCPRPNTELLPHCSKCFTTNNNLYSQFAGYDCLFKLGEGSMGEAWLMQEKNSGKEVVMKCMLPDAPSDRNRKNWFLREMSIGNQITHPNIVQQYQSGEKDDSYYILMEYCRGGNLKDFMQREDLKIAYTKKNGQQGTDKIFGGHSDEALQERIKIATHIIMQTLDGLHYIHHLPIAMTSIEGVQGSAGLIHRDVKPENILLTDQAWYPRVKLGDFGLAKAFHLAGLTKNTYTGLRGGDLKFIPVQQIIDYRYALPEVDVWAAAAVYYYMLTGLIPKNLVGAQVDEYVSALNDKAVPVRERDPRIPAGLAKVIDEALIEKPDAGIKTALELKNKIQEAIG